MSRVILLVVGLNTVITLGGAVFGYLHYSGRLGGAQAAPAPVEGARRAISEYAFYPIEKIVVNLPGENREHYFVLDLALQVDNKAHASTFKQIEPMVRNSVIASLSRLTFAELRAMSIAELQARLDLDLGKDFAAQGLDLPFSGVLISKLLVQ
uniref:flagellar basal body-associated FliL family protein n=1 Tax=Pseudomonas fluorescens TaxID=294 RepID=UPI001CD378B4|nr:flagellar basal body-associated FliL family protein [Pseudomonas fluorescens]